MELFKNLIYEYQKGMRDLVLYTCESSVLADYEILLKKMNIPYLIVDLGCDKVNLFFGNSACIDIIRSFSSSKLDKLTPQEDFILGIMLGYSRKEQYNRILTKL